MDDGWRKWEDKCTCTHTCTRTRTGACSSSYHSIRIYTSGTYTSPQWYISPLDFADFHKGCCYTVTRGRHTCYIDT